MPWWTWAALALFCIVLAAGAMFAVFAFLGLKKLRARGESLQVAVDGLAVKAERLEEQMERSEARMDEARRHFERLDASLQRLSVLAWALGDARRAVSQLRSGFLRK
jgi:predicted RNase H-like nuclease (RuvC/YqgF family)